MAKRKRSEHYVNNKEFLYAIVEYKANINPAIVIPMNTIIMGSIKLDKFSTTVSNSDS